jgi:hypothetical protein
VCVCVCVRVRVWVCVCMCVYDVCVLGAPILCNATNGML